MNIPKASPVSNKKITGPTARLSLESGESLCVGRYSPVGKGDLVAHTQKSASVILRDSQEAIQIKPVWKKRRRAKIGGESLSIVLKEIETEDELSGYQRLTQYHYRGSKGVGRSVPIIATVNSNELPKVIGFIEVTSSLLTNSARRAILDSKFSDLESGVAWVGWNGKTAKAYSNTIARISRCVVFPELRGIGLSTLLCHAAIDYCKTRWHIAGLKPIFLEITADMLRYYPFVRSSGFEYIGETAGNSDRLITDMRYLLRKYASEGRKGLPQGGGGIMSLQISYTETLRRMMSSSGKSLQQVVDILKKSPDKLTDNEWIALHKVYRRPKPTYLIGLNKSSHDFILKRKKALGIREPSSTFGFSEAPLCKEDLTVTVKSLSVSSQLSNSARSRAVQESFGFVSRGLTTNISSTFELRVNPGDVILISGPSGSGKSILLECLFRLLTGRLNSLPKNMNFNAEIDGSTKRCSMYTRPKMGVAPIDQFGDCSVETVLKVLAITGLAEPHTFVRPARSLSEGQKYRLGLAMALSKQPDFLFMDAFCESLDKFSSIAVCKSLRSASKEFGFGIIAATARPEFVADYLSPTIKINLTSTEEVRVINHDS